MNRFGRPRRLHVDDLSDRHDDPTLKEPSLTRTLANTAEGPAAEEEEERFPGDEGHGAGLQGSQEEGQGGSGVGRRRHGLSGVMRYATLSVASCG